MVDAIHITAFIITIFTILISLCLIFLYLKSKEFHKFDFYNIIIICIIFCLDFIIRVIPMDVYILRHIQAFLLTCLDKLILTTITCQAFILYLSVFHTIFFFKKDKNIFLISLILGFIISIILSTLDIIIASSKKGEGGIANFNNKIKYFYVINTNFKLISDTIFNGVFLFLNLLFFIITLIFRIKKQKEAKLSIVDIPNNGHDNPNLILMPLINSVMFIESYLIIYNIIPENLLDLIYLISCFSVDLHYSINRITIKETIKIFCRNLYKKLYIFKKKETIDIGCSDGDDEEYYI